MAELYAIVGTMERARFMLASGVPYLQLRWKDRPLLPHRAEIEEWGARYPSTRVIINDDLALAVSLGAWGLHLGQEDLLRYPVATLRDAPLKVGVSTHSDEEIKRAMACNPAMLGFGPVFPTTTKQVGHDPQGVRRLRRVVTRSALPIIAIGGINGGNLADVTATGVALVAMISYLDRFSELDALRAWMARWADQSRTTERKP